MKLVSLLGACPRKAIFRNLCVRLIRRRRTQNTQCIPPINPPEADAFLDLAKNLSFPDRLLVLYLGFCQNLDVIPVYVSRDL